MKLPGARGKEERETKKTWFRDNFFNFQIFETWKFNTQLIRPSIIICLMLKRFSEGLHLY